MATGYPTQKLLIVAKRVHEALSNKNFTHCFLGGLELILLGFERTTTDVDVAVKKQFFSLNNVKTIGTAFADNMNIFRVMDGTRQDGFRMLCNCNEDLDGTPEWIGVDVLIG